MIPSLLALGPKALVSLNQIVQIVQDKVKSLSDCF
jgi:hypothetical protein